MIRTMICLATVLVFGSAMAHTEFARETDQLPNAMERTAVAATPKSVYKPAQPMPKPIDSF